MNAVFAAVLLAVVATCSGTVVSGYGSQYYYPSSSLQYQYVQPSTQYQYVQPSTQYVHQPVVSSSNVVSQTYPAINYASYVPSTYAGLYGVQYPQYTYGAYGYGLNGLLKK